MHHYSVIAYIMLALMGVVMSILFDNIIVNILAVIFIGVGVIKAGYHFSMHRHIG